MLKYKFKRKIMKINSLNNLFLLFSLLILCFTSSAQETSIKATDSNSANKARFREILAERMSHRRETPSQNILTNEETNEKEQLNSKMPSGSKNTLDNPMQLVFSFAAPGTTIELPLSGTVNCTVDWDDGSAIENFTTAGLKPHTFASAGTYTVEISGNLAQFGINNYFSTWTGAGYLTQVQSFGDLGLTSLAYAFNNADNLLSLPITLPATITSLKYTFCKNDRPFFENLNSWDVSHVTNMGGTFSAAINFNQDISGWNVGSVTNMSELFATEVGNTVFNQPIGNWDVRNVINMDYMFVNNIAFNQPIGNWDVSNVESLEFLFAYASSFNQPIENWNLQKVTSLYALFGFATQFNQPLNNLDVSYINSSMTSMFYEATSFNQPLDNWDVSNVKYMEGMFYDATSFNQNIGNWNVSLVTDMKEMFRGATSFNQNIGNWNIESLLWADRMFDNTGLSTPNYDALLNGWAAKTVENNVKFSGGNSKYSNAATAARATLTGTHSWTITDGGMVPAAIDWANLSAPENANISFGDNLNVYGEVYADGYTNFVGQSLNIQAWVGWSETNTNPATWTNWAPAVYHSDNGNNDQYVANLGNILLLQGQPSGYYYAMRYQFDAGAYVYGGYNGGYWDGVNNVSGYLQIVPAVPLSNWAFALIGLLAVGVVLIRFRK